MGAVRTFARLLVPQPVREGIRSYIDHDFRDRKALEHDVRMGKVVFDHSGPVVQGGPFKGMIYSSGDSAFTLGPKLMGTYEMELNPIVERLVAADFKHVVNVGSGEGYYAVGLSRRLPNVHVIAFEVDAKKQVQLKTLAEANGVTHQIDIRGLADVNDVEKALQVPHPLLICDVEGAEFELLDPAAAPSLKNATILVEMHDVLRKGVSAAVQARFKTTHRLTVIQTQRRRKTDWPASVPMHSQWSACLSEGRASRMTWCLFEPNGD